MAKIEKELTKKQKRNTVVRKISTRENVALLWIFENKEEYLSTGKVNFNFDDFDDAELAKKDKFYFKVTDAEKEIMDNYLNQFVQGVSLGAYVGTLKKKGKMPSGYSPAPTVNSGSEQVAAPAQSDNGAFLVRKPGVPSHESCPCVNAPVPTTEERLAMEKLDRKPQKKAGTYNEYPFIINPNEELSAQNLDMPMILRMVELGKIDIHELQELTGLKYNRLYSLPPSSFANMTEEYKKEVDVTACLMEAEFKYSRVKDIFEEPEPEESETIDRYKRYLQSAMAVTASEEDLERVSMFMDRIYNVTNDTISFETADDDERETEDIKYTDLSNMKTDLICLCDKYKLDMQKQIDVFGKKTTVYKIIKEYYKKFPNGFDGEFFTTRKEAYLAGKLSV